MDELVATLAELEELAIQGESAAVSGHALRGAADAAILSVLTSAAHVQRLLDAVLVEAVGEVVERTDSPGSEGRMTHRFGCHNVAELVQRATLVSPVTAARYAKAATAVRQPVSFTSGALMEPALPELRAALGDGIVGLDGALAIAGPLLGMQRRADREAVLTADAVLAAQARGEGADAGLPACADLLRVQAQVWAAALDPDGAEPRERAAMHKRGLRLGPATETGVPVHGMLLPEVAAQFERIADAALNPRVNPDRLPGVHFADTDGDIDADPDALPERPFDQRTRAQKLHDVLAMALGVAAASELLPTIGGAAPTLVVSVREEDLATGRGYAHIDSAAAPVSLKAATHIGCAGTVQRIALDRTGRIRSLGTEERVFNRRQRRAIALRDGGCIIPGCGVVAAWSEIHHVEEHAHGGPTHTDNGVLLCWYHHRFLDFHGWKIRMNHGVPEVQAPTWMDPTRRWRQATTSPTRLLDTVLRT